MNSQADFAATYHHMSDGQLLETANEGGLILEAQHALSVELHLRNLKKSDLPRHIQSQRERLHQETKEKQLGTGGSGLIFFGRSYLNQTDREANIQLRTKWIAFVYLPLVPLASYRFKCRQEGWKWFSWTEQNPINRVPLNWDQVALTWLKASPFYLALLVLIFLSLTRR